MILRAKTEDLFYSTDLNETQIENSMTNKLEKESSIIKLKSYPMRIVLELTNSCNLNCIMCGRNYSEFKPTFFDIKWLHKIEPLLNYVEEVTLIGWGEPTVHPKFIEILEYFNKFNVRKFVCTNGMLLHKIKDAIFNFKLDLLTISLDGANAETNELIRQGSDFNKITNNIRELVLEKNKRKTSYPYLSTTTTIMKKNLHEFPKIIKLAGELGLDECKAVYLTAFSQELEKETLFNMKDEVAYVFDQAIRIAENYNLKVKLPFLQGEDEAGEKMHKDCFAAWRDFFLSSDGFVRPCMSTPIKLLKFDDYENFFDLWNSDDMQQFRKAVNNENMPNTCKNCYQASYANWNKKESFVQVGKEFAPKWDAAAIK